MKLSNNEAKFMAELGIEHVFVVTGGAALYAQIMSNLVEIPSCPRCGHVGD